MAKWFVYRVNVSGALAYIGKGSGRRHLSSARRLGGIAGIMEHFGREKSALKREIELIAELKPPMNRSPGGEGYSGKQPPRPFNWKLHWAKPAYERALRSNYWLDWLAAAAYLRCEVNELKRQISG